MDCLENGSVARPNLYVEEPGSVEQPVHRAVPQQRHVINGVRASDHPGDQRRDLQRGLSAADLADPDAAGDQVLKTGALGELQDRSQASARREVGVIKDRGVAVSDSHPADALL